MNCCGWRTLCKKGIVCLLVVCLLKGLIRNVLQRLVVKCSSFLFKGQENKPQTLRIGPLVGWPYCTEVTPHIGQVLRPKTLSTVPR